MEGQNVRVSADSSILSVKHRLSVRGFTYLGVLYLIIVMGIAAGAAGQSWQILMKREREEELLFRGRQIKDAITRWNTPRTGDHAVTPLTDLKELLRDPRTPHTVRYLRKVYADPVTAGDWGIIRDSSRGILGVASTSSDAPMKSAGFPDDLADFSGKTRYSDWQFVYTPSRQTQDVTSNRMEKTAETNP